MASLPAAPPTSEHPETEPRRPVDLLKAYKLRVQHGLSYSQIAEATGQPKASIHRALVDLCRLIDDPERLQHFQDVKPKLLSAVEERLIASLVDEEALTKASLNNRAYAFTQVFNARRLETGQSTQNTSILGTLILQAESQLGAGKSQAKPQAAPCLENNQADPEQAG